MEENEVPDCRQTWPLSGRPKAGPNLLLQQTVLPPSTATTHGKRHIVKQLEHEKFGTQFLDTQLLLKKKNQWNFLLPLL